MRSVRGRVVWCSCAKRFYNPYRPCSTFARRRIADTIPGQEDRLSRPLFVIHLSSAASFVSQDASRKRPTSNPETL